MTLVGYHSQLSLPPRNVLVTIHPGAVPVARPGVVPVSILGGPEFDVGEIDLATLELGPGGAHPTHHSGGHFVDVNGDCLIDLVAHFSARGGPGCRRRSGLRDRQYVRRPIFQRLRRDPHRSPLAARSLVESRQASTEGAGFRCA